MRGHSPDPQIARKLAPFWRGLNDHSSSWTEHQLVAAAKGKPIPAPDEIPQEDSPSPVATEKFNAPEQNRPPEPIFFPPPSATDSGTDAAASLPTTHKLFADSSSSPPGSNTPGPLFRGRAKTLASLTSTKSNQQSEITPQEVKLPKDLFYNGQRIEAYLYKDVGECPICFLYYPLYLNKTSCCEQPICSECFVQIKRPDPHPPEHTDPNSPAPDPTVVRQQEEEGNLVSEPATCPFCVKAGFGVTYQPPPFRRGLAHANLSSGSASAVMGSPSPLSAQTTNTSLSPETTMSSILSDSASTDSVITTDIVRPDWSKKLHDARAHAARRSAAATALHTAAYMMGGAGGSGFPSFGRRRRLQVVDSSGNGNGVPQRLEGMNPLHVEQMLAAMEGQGSARAERRGTHDLFPGRSSSRGSRTEDLEEMMMMEAIRQSLAAEEERKKKEEKEAAKEAKKEEKKRAKEQKKADKIARKNGGYSSSANNSGFFSTGSMSTTDLQESNAEGKGKARASTNEGPSGSQDRAKALGFSPLDEPTSVLNKDVDSTQSRSEAQRHLEQSRANLSSEATQPIPSNPYESPASGIPSNTANRLNPSVEQPLQQDQQQQHSSLNYGSLASMVGKEETAATTGTQPERQQTGNRSRGGSGESSSDDAAGSNTSVDVDGKHGSSVVMRPRGAETA